MMDRVGKTTMVWLFFLFAAFFAALMPAASHAGPALTETETLSQPGGFSFDARQRGDEWYNWVETADGYGTYQNTETGNWEYYQTSAGSDGSSPLMSISGAVVGVDDPAARCIPKGLRICSSTSPASSTRTRILA